MKHPVKAAQRGAASARPSRRCGVCPCVARVPLNRAAKRRSRTPNKGQQIRHLGGVSNTLVEKIRGAMRWQCTSEQRAWIPPLRCCQR